MKSQTTVKSLLFLALLGMASAWIPQTASAQTRVRAARRVKYRIYTVQVWKCRRPNGKWVRYGTYFVTRYTNGRYNAGDVRAVRNVAAAIRRSDRRNVTWIGNVKHWRTVYY